MINVLWTNIEIQHTVTNIPGPALSGCAGDTLSNKTLGPEGDQPKYCGGEQTSEAGVVGRSTTGGST